MQFFYDFLTTSLSRRFHATNKEFVVRFFGTFTGKIGMGLLCLWTTIAHAQPSSSVRGRLLEAFSLDPMAQVRVSLLQHKAVVASQLTDASGVFAFYNIPIGQYELLSCQQGCSPILVAPLELSHKTPDLRLLIVVEAESYDQDTLYFTPESLPPYPTYRQSNCQRRRTIVRQHRRAFRRRLH